MDVIKDRSVVTILVSPWKSLSSNPSGSPIIEKLANLTYT